VTSQERAAAWFTKADELLQEAEADLGGPEDPYGEALAELLPSRTPTALALIRPA
jgi:hypothetical protein